MALAQFHSFYWEQQEAPPVSDDDANWMEEGWGWSSSAATATPIPTFFSNWIERLSFRPQLQLRKEVSHG